MTMTVPSKPLWPPLISLSDFAEVSIVGDCVRVSFLGGFGSIDMSDEAALELSRQLADAAEKVLLTKIEYNWGA